MSNFETMMQKFTEDLEKNQVTDVVVIWATEGKPGMNTAFKGSVLTVMGWFVHLIFDWNFQLRTQRMVSEKPTLITPSGGLRQ